MKQSETIFGCERSAGPPLRSGLRRDARVPIPGGKTPDPAPDNDDRRRPHGTPRECPGRRQMTPQGRTAERCAPTEPATSPASDCEGVLGGARAEGGAVSGHAGRRAREAAPPASNLSHRAAAAKVSNRRASQPSNAAERNKGAARSLLAAGRPGRHDVRAPARGARCSVRAAVGTRGSGAPPAHRRFSRATRPLLFHAGAGRRATVGEVTRARAVAIRERSA